MSTSPEMEHRLEGMLILTTTWKDLDHWFGKLTQIFHQALLYPLVYIVLLPSS